MHTLWNCSLTGFNITRARKLSVEKRVLAQWISTAEIWLTLPTSPCLIAISCFWVATSLSLKTRVTALTSPYRSYYSAQPMRPGSLGPTCIHQEGLERRRTGPRQSKCSENNFHLSWKWMKRKHLAIIWCERFQTWSRSEGEGFGNS